MQIKFSRFFVPISFSLLSLFLPFKSFADCASNGATFHVAEGISGCIVVGLGHKVVHCTTSGLGQNANALVTTTGFNPDSDYPNPSNKIFINSNGQRITFSGVGTNPFAEIDFAYYGPWDPSYSYDLTCTW